MTWYDIEKIDEKLYRITEPKHWEHTNIYYYIGSERNLLIDTGTGIYPIKSLLQGIDDKPIDVVVTHGHWDHIGNIHEFEHVYVHPEDKDWLKNGLPIPRPVVMKMLKKGVSDDDLVGFKEPPFLHENPSSIESLKFEGLTFHHAPGHSPGSIVIYDENRCALFAGDVVYKGTIYCHYESTDPVALYESIKFLNTLEITTIYAGHYDLPNTKILEDLLDLMEELKAKRLLKHGSGKFCRQHVCLQL